MESESTNAVLAERRDVTDILSIVRVRPDGGAVPDFVPGQFLRLGLPRPPAPTDKLGPDGRPKRVRYTRRAYSIASAPTEKEATEFFVVRVEEGALTPQLWEIEPGGRLWMDTVAKGEFTLDLAPPGRTLVMIATGTGIAPFISMLRTYRGQGRWERFVVIHGVRYAADLGYHAELLDAAERDPTVRYVPLATRDTGATGWDGLSGRVQVALEPETFARIIGQPLDPQHCHVFLCGNPAMIDEVQALLEARGFAADRHGQPGNLHFERYW